MPTLYSLFHLLGVFIVFFLVIGAVLYLLLSIGLYKLALNRKIGNEWLAFIPLAQLFILGRLIRNVRIFNSEILYIEFVLPIAALIVIVLGGIPVLGTLLALAFAVLFYSCVYRLFVIYKGREEAATMLIISIVSIILCGFMMPVYVYMMRDLKPIQNV